MIRVIEEENLGNCAFELFFSTLHIIIFISLCIVYHLVISIWYVYTNTIGLPQYTHGLLHFYTVPFPSYWLILFGKVIVPVFLFLGIIYGLYCQCDQAFLSQ